MCSLSSGVLISKSLNVSIQHGVAAETKSISSERLRGEKKYSGDMKKEMEN